jgi:hypothetical protein
MPVVVPPSIAAAAAAAAAANDGRPYVTWKDKKYLLSMEVVMTALQDEGTVDKKSEEGNLKFTKIKSLALKLWKHLRTYKKDDCLDNLPANPTRGGELLYKLLLRLRKHVDKVEVFAEQAAYGKASATKVYIIRNDLEFYGMDMLFNNLFNYLSSKSTTREANRNGSDAVRVMSILLDPKHRIPLQTYLKGTKTTRAECDQTVDPNTAFALQCLVDFNNPDYLVQRPDALLDQDLVGGVDPNDLTRISHDREPKWFLETWSKYVKSKYREALRKWHSETGNGSGKSADKFGDYCLGDRWLTWIYMQDITCAHILWCSATGKPPPNVGRESGFDNEIDLTDDASLLTSPSFSVQKKRRIDSTDELLRNTKKSTAAIHGITSRIGGMLDRRELEQSSKPASVTIIDNLCTAVKQKEYLMSSTMSPASKAAVEATINKRVSNLGNQLKELNKDEGEAVRTLI